MEDLKMKKELIKKLTQKYGDFIIDVDFESETFMGEEINRLMYHSINSHVIYKGVLEHNKTTNEWKFTHDIMY